MRCAARYRDDRGTIGILTLGFAVVALLLILVVSAATAVHVIRLRLMHLADELAEDAADAVNTGGYFAAGAGGSDLGLADDLMLDVVTRHVAERGTGHLEGVHLVSIDAADDSTASVTIEVVVYPLFGVEALMPFADGITLRATGEARAF